MSSVRFKGYDYDLDAKEMSYKTVSPATDGSDLTTWGNNLIGLRDAMLGVLEIAQFSEFERCAFVTESTPVAASSPVAQKHYRAVIEYVDTVTTNVFQDYFLMMPKISDTTLWQTVGGRTEWIPTEAEWVAFKTAFERDVLSKRDRNPITIRNIYLEGS